MKKLLMATALLTLTTSTFAATSGTLLLRGSVPRILSITVTGETIAQTLDLTTNKTDLKVATVNEKSNSKTGYKITVASANLGKLKRTDGSEVFTYTMKYGNQAVNLGSSQDLVISNVAGTVNVNKDVSVSYTGVAQDSMVEGTYEDTVTLSIAAN
jgi:hypothetical protein